MEAKNKIILLIIKILLDITRKIWYDNRDVCAAVVELADAPDSKSGGSDTVTVRPRPAAPFYTNNKCTMKNDEATLRGQTKNLTFAGSFFLCQNRAVPLYV